MRTETITREMYTFNELSDDAKETARNWWRESDNWDSSEWWGSAIAFNAISPIAVESADYDRGQVDVIWQGDDDAQHLTGLRAWKWLQNNGWFEWAKQEKPGACTATGFCGDAPFADPLVEYASNPLSVPDLLQVFYECAQAWVFEARSDMESRNEDSQIDETIEANEYEFTVEGELI